MVTARFIASYVNPHAAPFPSTYPVMFGPSYEYVVVTPLPSVWDKEVCELEKSRIPEFEKEIIRSYNSSKKCFDEAPEDDRDSLQLFAFICNLSFDIYVKKQIVEKLLDNFPDLLHSENTGVKKDSAKKKK